MGYVEDDIRRDNLDGLENEKTLRQSTSSCRRWLDYFSELDRRYSERIQRNDSTCIEAVFFFVPGQMFNRMIILVPMAITLMLGANSYDSMLVENGYKPVGENIKDV